jgi:hypothetical protein
MQNGLRQNMGRGMPKGLFAFVIVKGQNFDFAVGLDGRAQVADGAVNAGDARRLGQPAPELANQIVQRASCRHLTCAVVF